MSHNFLIAVTKGLQISYIRLAYIYFIFGSISVVRNVK